MIETTLIGLELLRTPESVKLALSRDSIYKQVLEIDNLNKWVPDFNYTLWFSVNRLEIPIGLLILFQITSNTLTFHGGLYEPFRHQFSATYLKHALNKVKQWYPTTTLITTVASHNKPALSLIKKIGFKEKCVIPDGFKSGDLIIFSEK